MPASTTMAGFILLLIMIQSVTTLRYRDHWLHQIYVNNQAGVNDSSCWEGGYSTPCLYLSLALKGVQHYNHSTAILLQPGQHYLHSGRETQLWNVSQLAIVGNGSKGEVVIRCGPLAGLGFFWSEDIEVRNVSLIGCGAIQDSISGNIKGNTLEYIKTQAAVTLRDCNNIISFVHVIINESNGTGLLIYNILDEAYIDGCYFSCSGRSSHQNSFYGGRGLAIELTHKAPLQSRIHIANSAFTNNIASSVHFRPLYPKIMSNGYIGHGGGGLSVVFREGAANNAVQLSAVRLEGNTAQFGGGIFLAFFENAFNNTININDSKVTGNQATIATEDSLLKSYEGGGVLLTFISRDKGWPVGNTIIIGNSSVTSNEAGYGGGIAVDISHDQHRCLATSNKLVVDKCVFHNNQAFQGSSAYFFEGSHRCLPLLHTKMSDSNFTDGHCGTSIQSEFKRCYGNLFLHTVSLYFSGSIMLYNNQQSALELHSSSIELTPGTLLHFINNSALNGAALHLVACSTLTVNNSTSLLFQSNKAAYHGGAIYAESCDVRQTRDRMCFVKHINSALHPNHWKANFTFIDNTASANPNSIYVDSIYSCIWPDLSLLVSSTHSTFCWRGWSYQNSSGGEEHCLQQLMSAPATVNTSVTIITVFPGETVNLLVNVYDDWSRNITAETTFHVQVRSGPAFIGIRNHSGFNLVKSITLTPSITQSVTLLAECDSQCYGYSSILAVGPPQLPALIKVNFNSCEKLTQRNSSYCSQGTCVLEVYNLLHCHSSPIPAHCISLTPTQKCALTGFASLPTSTCISAVPTTNELLGGTCPSSYSNISVGSVEVKTLISNILSNLTCAPHREGRLCGRCAEGYGVAINSLDFVCTTCESYLGVAIFSGLELLPVLIMMIILALFNINITNGCLNGFVLYSQLLTLHMVGHNFPYYFLQASIVYSIWNLNFLTLYPDPFCIPHVETAVKVIALQYVIAAYPLFFIALTFTWIQLYYYGFRCVMSITRPVHLLLVHFWKKLKFQPSLINTYAGLILLSYMRFVDISIKLLKYTTVTHFTEKNVKPILAFYYDANLDYFGWPHTIYGVLAIVCLLFVVPPTALLLLYHFKTFQKCLSLCKLDRPGLHALVEVYQGCFKNTTTDGAERRYFAGIYLLCRLLFVLNLSFVEVHFAGPQYLILIELIVMGGMVAVLRPYRKTAHNVIDVLLFLFAFMMVLESMLVNDTIDYYLITLIPAFVLICYIIYQFLKWLCCTVGASSCRKEIQLQPEEEEEVEEAVDQPLLPPSSSEVNISDYTLDDLFADRVLNPIGYSKEL